MSWYKKVASVRDDKVDQVTSLVEKLNKSQEGCFIDKGSSKDLVDGILTEINTGSEMFKLPTGVKEALLTYLTDASAIILDSPQKFFNLIEDSKSFLDDYLYSLAME